MAHASLDRTGTALCLASAAALGVMAIFGKLAYEAGVGVMTLLCVRFALAAPIFWLALGRASVPVRAPRRAVVAALALGGIGYATQAGLFFAALTRMDASLLSVVLYTYPAFVTVAAIALRREAATRRRVGALVLSSVGVVLVLAGAGTGSLDAIAVAMALASALTYTVYIFVSDSASAELQPLLVSALVTTGAATTLAIAGAASGSLDFGFEPKGWLWLSLIALVCTAAAIVLFFAGLKRVGPSAAAILSTAEPPVTVTLAFLTFGEALAMSQIAGALLVVSAVVLMNLRSARAPEAPLPAQAR
jgi:drug/metabolite transporter (DMT)-like permease